MRSWRRRWASSRRKAAACGLALWGCAGGAPAAGDGGVAERVGDALQGCVIGRAPLEVAPGVFPYIEPEDLIQVGSSWVVVGSPSYTWAPGEPGDSLPLTVNRHLAARFALDGRATLIERPVQDSVGSVRALALDGDRWGVLFNIERRAPQGMLWDTESLWYAEHDGRGWALLEPLPMPADRRVDMFSSSEVVRVDEELVWIVPMRLPNDLTELVEYRRRDDVWHSRIVSDDWVEISTLAYTPESGLWMAHFSEDPGLPGWQQSLRLYRYEGSWSLAARVATMPPGRKVSEPAISIVGGGPIVSWLVEGGGAHAWIGSPDAREGTTIDLDPSALQVMPLVLRTGSVAWIVRHLDEDRNRIELRYLRERALFGAERVAAAVSPYLAFLASRATASGDALIVGPEVSSDPADPFVRSLILRLSPSCT